MGSVTFSTSCWEQDWDILLKTNFLKNKIERNNYAFTKKVLIINNVKDRAKVEKYARIAVECDVLTDYFFVEDYIEAALKSFELTKEALGRGYYYSNHELTSIYLCSTDYLLFYTGDTWLDKTVPWVAPAIDEFEKNSVYKVANPVWNYMFSHAKSVNTSEVGDFWVGYGFSDQCFLVRTKEFKAPIYNETNPASAQYPLYGGETFEKRVYSWMRNHHYLRLTYKHGSYIHEDFPKRKCVKKINMALGKYDK
jgi:hypothetical protein